MYTTYSDDSIVLNEAYTGDLRVGLIDNHSQEGFRTYVVNALNSSLPPIEERKSLFTTKTLYNKKNEAVLFGGSHNTSLVFGLVLFLGIIYLIYSKLNPIRFIDLIGISLSNRRTKFLSYETRILNEIFFLLGFSFFIPVFALIIYTSFDYFHPIVLPEGITSILLYLIILGSVLVFYSLKIALTYVFGLIFNLKNIISYYLTNQTVFLAIKGVFLLPLSVFYFFLHPNYSLALLISNLILLAILLIIRLVRGFSLVSAEKRFSKVYLFFYLCSLELLPLIIVFKLVNG